LTSLPGGTQSPGEATDHISVSLSPDLVPRSSVPVEQLLLHCLALGKPSSRRGTAQERLEKALGRELAQRLIATLTVGSRS
jgi:hypothetical protein